MRARYIRGLNLSMSEERTGRMRDRMLSQWQDSAFVTAYRARQCVAVNTKLSPDAVRAIRSDDRSLRVIGQAYGVSRTAIRRIRKGLTYKRIE